MKIPFTSIMALEDSFENLLDVDLDTEDYELYFKNRSFYEEISRSISKKHGFFEDISEYIERFSFSGDTDGILRIMNKEFIVRTLNAKNHIEHTCRLLIDGKTVWYRFRIVYKNLEKKNIIVGIFKAEKEIEKAADYGGAFLIDCERNIRRTVFDTLSGAEKYDDSENYSDLISQYINNCVSEADREKMRKETSMEQMHSRAENENDYKVEYRDITTGMQRFFEMRIIKISDCEVMQCFKENEEEIIDKLIFDTLKNEYFAIFCVDIDLDVAQVVKKSPWYYIGEEGEFRQFSPIARKFGSEFEGETKVFFNNIGDRDYIRKRFKDEDKATYIYKSRFVNSIKWVCVTGLVIKRHINGDPAILALTFGMADVFETARQEMRIRLAEDMQMISGIAGEYHALYYVNIAENSFKVYSFEEERFPEIQKMLEESKHPIEVLRAYGKSGLVHPDDRHFFEEITFENIMQRLFHKKKFTIRYRQKFSDAFLWMEMDVIKFEEKDEHPNAIAIGFSEKDEEIRSEEVLNTCLSVLGMEISPKKAIDILLSTIGEFYGAERCYIFRFKYNEETFCNTFEWVKKGIEPMINLLQNIPIKEAEGWISEFKKKGAIMLDSMDSEHNTEEGKEILEMQGIESLLAVPIVNDDEIKGFIGVDNPSRAQNNIFILKTMANVVYSEILKNKENDEEHITLGKLSDAFVSVYYVDLSIDYITTRKIAEEYKEEYGKTEHYSVSMGGYVREKIAERDRERCIKMTDPAYILETFKTKDRFSIDMTDIMLGYERNFVFDYIKVNEEGTKFVICCRDVTDALKKEREQALILEKARDIADAANKSKTRFLFNMSHDIRTPLNAIMGFTQMAQKYMNDKERLAEYLRKIDMSSSQLLGLVNQVLEMARIESGKITVEEEPINVRREYNEMVTVFAAQAQKNGQEFICALEDIKHDDILADRARMSSITLNIAGNALKYTPKGGKIVFLLKETKPRKEGCATFVFSVEDTGIGMSSEYMEVLFEPFSREKNTTVSKIQGTGLGLSIVKSLVDLLDGEIKVESTPGKGTRFDIIIDFKINTEVCEPGKNIEAQPISMEGKKILLVEDNEMNREIAVDLLCERGIIVEEAGDGTEAISLIRQKGMYYFDCILMDIQMPLMNGFEATRIIREMCDGRHIPIIALSANAFSEDREKSIEAGMDDHISKPIDVKELFCVLEKYMDK